MSSLFPLIPTSEYRKVLSDGYLFNISFLNLSQADKSTLRDFYLNNSKNYFYYYPKNNYTIYDDTGISYVKDVVSIISKDETNKKTNLWVYDNIVEYRIDSTLPSYSINEVINAPFTCYIEQAHSSDGSVYMTAYNNDLDIVVKRVSEDNHIYLVLSVNLYNKAYYDFIKINPEDLLSSRFIYSISINSNEVVLVHSNKYVSIKLDSDDFDTTNFEIELYSTVFNFVLINDFVEGEALRNYKYPVYITYPISINANNTATYNAGNLTAVYGKPRYKVKFKYDVLNTSTTNTITKLVAFYP